MKKLLVTIQLELDIPNTWNLVEHPDKMQVIQMDNGNYMDMSCMPMLTSEFSECARWINGYPNGFEDEFWAMVVNEEVSMELEIN